MRKLYENFHIFHFQKRIVSAETIRGNTVFIQGPIQGPIDRITRLPTYDRLK
jgi:hypothetical protein